MNLLEKLDMLKELKGDNNNSLSKKSGIPYSTIDNLYKKGYENIKLSTLQTLCDYFGVTLDFLARDDWFEDKGKQALCAMYDELNEAGRKVLMAQAEFLLSRPEYKKDIPEQGIS